MTPAWRSKLRPAVDGPAWDAIVVGAGPAGALAALELTRLGARVLLVDRAVFPRWKVCGCCLNQRGLAALEAAGLASRIASLGPRPQRQIRLAAVQAEARLPLPGCVSLSREQLDATLIAAAADAGAAFVSGTRARLLDGDRTSGTHDVELVTAGGDPPLIARGRVVIAADGLGGSFAVDRLGGEHVRRRGRIGAGVVLDAATATDWDDDCVNMAIGRAGYVGVVRLEDGRWNLAAALDADAVRRSGSLASTVGEILRRVGWSVPRSLEEAPWRGTPRLWRRPRQVAAERLFAVGDAGGYVEPFTGEGMTWALAAGRAVAPVASQAMARWDHGLIEEWARVLWHDVQRGQTTSRLAAWSLGSPAIAGVVTAVLALWPGLAAPAISRLNAVEVARGEGGTA